MAETNTQRLDRLHEELAALYRSGLRHDRPADDGRLAHYWVRIYKLEDALHREALADEASFYRRAALAADEKETDEDS